MAYTAEQLQALKEALANGVTSVRFGDREVTYRSVEEIQTIIATVETELAKATTGTVRQVRIYTGKGL